MIDPVGDVPNWPTGYGLDEFVNKREPRGRKPPGSPRKKMKHAQAQGRHMAEAIGKRKNPELGVNTTS